MLTYRYDPPNSTPAVSCRPGTWLLRSWCLARWPLLTNLGCLAHRKVAGSERWSAHNNGRAFDLGLWHNSPRSFADADFAAELLAKHAILLGIQGIIFAGRAWGFGTPSWHNYHGSDPHYDHVHVEQNYFGAMNEGDAVNQYLDEMEMDVLLNSQWDKLQQDTYFTHVKLDQILAALERIHQALVSPASGVDPPSRFSG